MGKNDVAKIEWPPRPKILPLEVILPQPSWQGDPYSLEGAIIIKQ